MCQGGQRLVPIFSKDLLASIKMLVYQHHTVYPQLPPQGIYFESLVERAFRITGKPFTAIEPSTPNAPAHDLMIDGHRLRSRLKRALERRRTELGPQELLFGSWLI
jgi:hypothetical protein